MKETEETQKMTMDMVAGIAYKYLHMPDTVERDTALLKMQNHPCLSAAAKRKLAVNLETKNTGIAFPAYEDYCFDSFQDFLIDEIIKNINVIRESDFKYTIYNKLVAFWENPLCPFDKPTCSYGVWEDMDDITFDYIEALRKRDT